MKIAIAQNDYKIGDIKYNYNKIFESVQKAKQNGAKLIVFSKSPIIGYPMKDILYRHKALIGEEKETINELAKLADDITIVICYANLTSKKTIAILQNNNVIKNTNIFELDGTRFQVITNEKNISKVIKSDVIIHCDASSSRYGKEFYRNAKLASLAKKFAINYIWINQCGYNDNLVFDGASRIYNSNGELTARCKSFEEDFMLIENLKGDIQPLPIGSDIKKGNEFNINDNYQADLSRTYSSLILGIKSYFKKTGFKKAVLGLSGGLDSSVCSVLLADALGKENVYAISMPTKISSQGSKDDAKLLAENLGINYIEAPITNEIDVYTKELNNIFDKIPDEKYLNSTTFENIQARTRATLLWGISNEFKSMLTIATSDKSEAYIGYATVNGDMSGGFAPIADVTKTKLFALADYINKMDNNRNVIPKSILTKPPGAELKFDKEKGRTVTAEEDNMPYLFLDEVIWLIENNNFGFKKLIKHKYLFENDNPISQEQKEEWIAKFYKKMYAAIFKWHLLPPAIITDSNTINQSEYYHPIV